MGVSIASGAVSINTAATTLNVIAPAGTTRLLVANDGGFAGATSKPWDPSNLYSHTLTTSGAERLPKTVYVRFIGSGDDTKTFSDDIILDQTAPLLRSATASGGTGGARAFRALNLTATTVRAKATDATSGVKFLELAAKKGGRSVTVKYAPKVTVKGVGPRPYVRAIDGAGNRSGWKRATR